MLSAFVLATSLLAIPGNVAAHTLLATGIRVEGKRSGPGQNEYVDSASPRLSWAVTVAPEYAGVNVSSRQFGYRVVAAHSVDAFDRGDYDAWESGNVSSLETMHVRYRGSGLEVVGSTVVIGVFVFDAAWRTPLKPAGPVAVHRAPGRGEPWAGASWLGQTAAEWPSDCAQYQDDPEPLFRLPIATGAFAGGVSKAHLFITGE